MGPSREPKGTRGAYGRQLRGALIRKLCTVVGPHAVHKFPFPKSAKRKPKGTCRAEKDGRGPPNGGPEAASEAQKPQGKCRKLCTGAGHTLYTNFASPKCL